ncbi:hypothetical protein ACFRIC_34400 [Streptomyces sp. NPDC056738]
MLSTPVASTAHSVGVRTGAGDVTHSPDDHTSGAADVPALPVLACGGRAA